MFWRKKTTKKRTFASHEKESLVFFILFFVTLPALSALYPQDFPIISNNSKKEMSNELKRPLNLHQPSLIKTDGSPLHAHYFNVKSTDIDLILDDSLNRVDPLFTVPKEIKKQVRFWLEVYAKYSTYQTVIFDRDYPEQVYDFQDDRIFFDKGMNAVQIEVNSKLQMKRKLSGLRAAFETLRRNPNAKFKVGTPGHTILRLWGKKKSGEWGTIARRLKTQKGQRDFILRGIQNSQPFMPAMEEIFRSYNLPTELTRIPLLESSFQIEAFSKSAAVGVWQFLEKSAQEYLTVDKKMGLDERLSPIKTAHAAAKMFKRNYKILNNYALAIIAYNHGIRNFIKYKSRISRVKFSTLLDPKNKNSFLGFASRNYYCEFLAILLADRYKDLLYSIKPENANARFVVTLLPLKKPSSVFELSSQYDVNLDDLRLFNPDIFNIKKRLPGGVKVVIPKRG